ncbi:MAG TPA: hypothetical protein VFH71_11145 [Rhodanobacteraceae bacterium]|nr:hypothetical protein [Rhodanobacteraceae bacterium]
MQPQASHRCVVFALIAMLAVFAPAHAGIRLQADFLGVPGATLKDLQASLAPGADGRPQLQLRAAHVSLPALGWKDVALDLSGVPVRAGTHAWQLDGQLAVSRAPGNALANAKVSVAIDTDAGSLDIHFDQRDTALRVLMPLDQPTHLSVSLKGLPLAWLQGVLASAWSGGRVTAGTLQGDLALDLPAQGAQISGKVAIENGGFDSAAGTLAGQQVGLRGTFSLDTAPAQTHFNFDGSLDGGQMLLGPLYAQLPSHSAQLQLAATVDARGIAIDNLHFDDGDALSLGGKLAFDAKDNLTSLDFRRFQARLPDAYTRYGSSWLATLGWKDLTTSGSLSGSVAMTQGVPQQFDMHASNVSINDGGGRIALNGLNGELDWDAQAPRPASSLSWQSLAFYKLPFGAATLHFKSDAGALALMDPVQLTLLGGTFSLQNVSWRPAAQQDRLNAAFAVANIDVPSLCKLFGWPQFPGTLGGAVPGLRYSGDKIMLEGGLSLHVFDGFVDVTSLALEQPFGVAPVLAADIDLKQLDLGQLTSVFDFGSITGKLDGSIHDLRMVNWQPVAFDAALHADSGGRISQRALKSLTQVGGGGIAAGLQGLALNLFKTFGYSRIGLSCVLRAQVCTMGGVEPSPDGSGYTIVEGSGLPHISVIGHQREVDWPTLVDRLKTATEGGGPVVR